MRIYYGISKRKHTTGIRTDKKGYLYDLKKHHGEVEDCIIFGLSAITGRSILFIVLWKMELSSTVSRLSAFIQRGFNPEAVPRRRLDESYSYGIVSAIILLFILGIF